MSLDANKALVRRYLEEVGNQRKLDVADALFAPNFQIFPDYPPGPAGVKQLITRLVAAFPDLFVTIEHLIAEGDVVAAHITLHGTQQAAWGDIPPTNKRMAAREMQFYRIADGQIIERWIIFDGLQMRQQLGVALN
jgi:steroid delta-isomerase-like uncharacterized protein